MQGNGESKLSVKGSKLCSWNCCWSLLYEGPGEVPLTGVLNMTVECKWARVKSRELAPILCCAPLAWALLHGWDTAR